MTTRDEVIEMTARMLPPLHEPLRTQVAEEWADQWLDRFTITPKARGATSPLPVVSDAAVSRGLAQSAAGETVDLGDFTQYLIPDAAVEAAARAICVPRHRAPAGWPLVDVKDYCGRCLYQSESALAAALPHLDATPSASVKCPGTFVGWSAFGATYPDTVCSSALTWDAGAEPPSATLCDADDDHRPKDIPCPVCDPAGFDRYEGRSGAYLTVYRLCGLVPEPDAAPSATREDDLLTEPHDGHEPSVTCPGCPHDTSSATRESMMAIIAEHEHDEGVSVCACGEWEAWDEEDWGKRAASWGAHLTDVFLARFTVTAKETP